MNFSVVVQGERFVIGSIETRSLSLDHSRSSFAKSLGLSFCWGRLSESLGPFFLGPGPSFVIHGSSGISSDTSCKKGVPGLPWNDSLSLGDS